MILAKVQSAYTIQPVCALRESVPLAGFVVNHEEDQNSTVRVPGLDANIDFLWRPFPANLTQEVASWACQDALAQSASETRRAPDLVVANSMLWHVLEVTDALDFEQQLGVYKQEVGRLHSRCEAVRSCRDGREVS